MPDQILRVGAEFDVGPLVAGAQQAGTAVNSLSDRFKQLAKDAALAGNDILQEAAIFQSQGLSAKEAASAMENLGYDQKAAATAAASVASAAGVAANALEGQAVAATGTATATRALAESQNQVYASTLQARVVTDVLTGNISRADQAIVRMSAHSEILGPLIQAAFVPFALYAFGTAISEVASKIVELSDNMVGYTKAVQEAEKADIKFSDSALGHAVTLRGAQESLRDIVAEQGRIASESFGEKWRTAFETSTHVTFQQEGALASLRDALLMTAKDPLAPFEALTGAIGGLFHAERDAADYAVKLGEAQRRASEEVAKETVELDRQALKLVEGQTVAEKSAIHGNTSQYSERTRQIQFEIEALGQKQRLEEDIAAKEVVAKGGTPSDQEIARATVAEESYNKRIELTNQLSISEQEYTEKLARDNEQARERLRIDLAHAHFPVEAVTQPPETPAMEEANKKMAENAVAAVQTLKDASATAADQLDIAFEKSFERMAETARKAWEKATEAAKKAAEEQKREVDRMTETMTRAFENSFDGVIRGTETVKFAFIKLGGDMVLAVVHSLEQQVAHFAAAEVMKLALHVSGQTAQTAATASGTASREGIEEVAFLKFLAREAAKLIAWVARETAQTIAAIAGFVQREAILIAETVATVTKYAAQAAAGAFAATVGIPIIGPFIAPAAAAGAFAAVEAFGFAEQGAVLAHDTMVAAHKNEMILPAPISSAVQGAVPAIQAFNAASKEGFGGIGAPGAAGAAGQAGAAGVGAPRIGGSTTNVNIHAMDAQSMADAFQRSRSTVLGMVRGAIRNGVRV